jgi:RNA recognition motif-containing protein
MNSRLYIGNLSPTVTEVQLMLEAATQQSRGFAFVTMATPELAAAALKDFHCFNLGGRYITVTEAPPPQEPKGLMSEGFGIANPPPFRPAFPRDNPRGAVEIAVAESNPPFSTKPRLPLLSVHCRSTF